MVKKNKTPKPVLSEAAKQYFKAMGAVGGHKRAANLTAAERKAIAIKAVKARWEEARRVKP